MCYLNWDTSTPQLEQNELAVCAVGSEKDVFVVRVVKFIKERGEKGGKKRAFLYLFQILTSFIVLQKKKKLGVKSYKLGKKCDSIKSSGRL